MCRDAAELEWSLIPLIEILAHSSVQNYITRSQSRELGPDLHSPLVVSAPDPRAWRSPAKRPTRREGTFILSIDSCVIIYALVRQTKYIQYLMYQNQLFIYTYTVSRESLYSLILAALGGPDWFGLCMHIYYLSLIAFADRVGWDGRLSDSLLDLQWGKRIARLVIPAGPTNLPDLSADSNLFPLHAT